MEEGIARVAATAGSAGEGNGSVASDGSEVATKSFIPVEADVWSDAAGGAG